MANRDRDRIVSQIPAPDSSRALVSRLATMNPAALAALACDRREKWWRRRPCALALRGRVVEADALLERVMDRDDVGEVRRAVLDALSDPAFGPIAARLLAWLRAETGREQAHGMAEAILGARANLGDLDVLPRLTALAADPWSHRRAAGEAAIERLIATHGLGAVLRALGHADLAGLAFTAATWDQRLLGVCLLHRTGGDVSPALADDEVVVAERAHALIAAGDAPSDAVLHALVDAGRLAAARHLADECPRGPAGACLWALCALHERGRDVADVWRALGGPRVPLAGVPDDVRRAIVREYAPGQRQTDPRWLLEKLCVGPCEPPDEAVQLARAVAALERAGLAPDKPRSAGEIYQQGDGTYHDIAFTGGVVSISTLGPFVTFEADVPLARDALIAAGFRIIDAPLAAILVTGLHVYSFGDRQPLRVGELLFYWQD